MYNIAVIDDEADILNIIDRYLTKKGKYTVTTYTNPLKALENIDKNYDVILTDIMMPQLNGIDLLEKILEINPNQKVIMMTAYSTLEKVLDSHQKGAVYYLTKPFESLSTLESKIQEAIND